MLTERLDNVACRGCWFLGLGEKQPYIDFLPRLKQINSSDLTKQILPTTLQAIWNEQLEVHYLMPFGRGSRDFSAIDGQ
jgi:hypothetical protein